MTRTCLVGVQGPLQLCSGLIAMEWYGLMKRGSANTEAVLLLYDFLIVPEQEEQIVEEIMQIASVFKWKKIVFIGGREMNEINLSNNKTSIKRLRNKIGNYEFDQVFLARNYIGLGSSLILNSYPEAIKVCYGDGFGVVGTEIFTNVFSGSNAGLYWRIIGFIKNILFGKISIKGIYKRILGKFKVETLRGFAFDAAVLILPMDYSGKYLNQLPFYVPSLEHVRGTFERINKSMLGLNNYCLDLIKNVSGECYLYLLVTPTESGSTSLKNEIKMYLETIRENSPRGATIFIKLHPRKSITFGDYILADLRNEYNIIVINQGKFKSIPIEFWGPLIARCKIISFSSSSLSLRYIYNKEVITGLSVDKVRKFYFKKMQSVFEDDYHLWNEAAEALNSWDGKSILWSRAKTKRRIKKG